MAKRSTPANEGRGGIDPRLPPPHKAEGEGIGDARSSVAEISPPKRRAGISGGREADAGVGDGSSPDPRDAAKHPGHESLVDDSDKHSKVKNVTTWIVSDPSPSPVPGPRRKPPFSSSDARPDAGVATGSDAPVTETPGGRLPDDASRNEPAADPRPPAESLHLLSASLPVDYPRRSETLAAMTMAYREELASQLAPALNAHIRTMPQETYEEKKALAKWVNDELRRFDLAINCPKTGQGSILLAIPGNHPEVGRFAIEHKTPEGKRVRSVTTPQLPPLDLMVADPRREALLEWRDRVGDRRGGIAEPIGGLEGLDREHKQRIAVDVGKSLAEEMQRRPHDSYEEKKELSKFVNAELRKFGLAIKCPKTGRPSSLIANPGYRPGEGRFQLFNEDEDGKKVRSLSTPHLSTLLESLELVADDPDRKRWGKFTDRLGQGGRGPAVG